MPRFLIKQNQIENGQVIISGADYRHIVKVLRLKIGNEITLFDEDGVEHAGAISEIGTREIKVAIVESRRVETESQLNITLLQGMPKGDKMDFIVEKATELGVKTIVPVATERSQIRETKKVQRWRRIAVESSKQCGRVKPPDVRDVSGFQEAVELGAFGELKIIFYEKCKDKIKDICGNAEKQPQSVSLFIGPEGGFTEREVEAAKAKGFTAAGLGPRILRTETAGVVTIAILQFLYGDI